MCLAIPHRIIEIIDGERAYAAAGNIKIQIRTDLIEDPQIGDAVLVHAGFAIEKLEIEDSMELEELWDEIREYVNE